MLVPVLAFVSVIMMGSAIISATTAKRRAVRRRLADLDRQFDAAATAAPKASLLTALGNIGKMFSVGSPSTSLRQELINAGFHGRSAPGVYLGAKQFMLVVGLGGCLALVYRTGMPIHLKVLIVLMGAGLMFFVPNIFVRSRRRKRTVDVRHHLPDVVDLLEICVASGMGLDMAWNSVAEEIRRVSTILADEMALTNLEMHLGAPRATAMRHMAERTQVAELSSLVALLVQSDRFGTSIRETLKTFAHSMREERTQRAQEAAEKMAVKLLFPMVLFIFPAVLIVMAGPAAIKLFEVMGTR
ncbi:hypothetical protein LCGC14_1972680 [marine sediment metagenome]|uniref:Type II secretion system protein GspF domain-containing protein n=1 Tax=marine sediment metagenome TaxID=412755 RepID=A0A0F9FBQ2_9ZZZZ